MPTFREFKSQRPNRVLFDTLTFYNQTFGYIRLVDRQVFPKTFAGQIYTPCRMEINESQQSSTPVIDCSVKFSRLAQDFKQQLKLWRGHARITPISATYQRFDSADMNTPLKPWTLYVNDVSMDQSDVTVTLTLKNPLNNNIGRLYTPEEFPGLQNA
ncbi:DUF1833 domain-containing protein [Pantoea agglomerans]|uniref:DUF1833 family protein n=1 Tax=Enterobacter agglomerans TaxID=549 RepID=UPI0013BE698F|nr:DUF1833 family protein [Pantoea agglomerans]NEG85115.1 DUF1833 domain-containing protein [Pantoea agglomerans]NEH07062.1 DUF1833 domain-containing protein [Pantoea agglomerans]